MRRLKISATTRAILKIAGVGAFIAGTLVFPGLPRIINHKAFDLDKFLDDLEWRPFDQYRLREKLKVLHKQKMVRIYEKDGKYVVQLTKKGRRKLIQYKLEEIEIPKQEKWDGRWRIVTYDIPKEKKSARDALRKTIKNLGFYELQKSVYLFPYPCTEAIEFIRELYQVGENVTLLTVGYLENEELFKEYFDL